MINFLKCAVDLLIVSPLLLYHCIFKMDKEIEKAKADLEKDYQKKRRLLGLK